MFPSPCGEKVGINQPVGQDKARTDPGVVSVPLRGKGRDQLKQAFTTVMPSPHVSVPLRGKGRDQPDMLKRADLLRKFLFPSPCGEKVGINFFKESDHEAQVHLVSVPLRGKGRDQPTLVGRVTLAFLFVSVPLRGKGRDQQDCMQLHFEVVLKFPSPCGEKVGINTNLPRTSTQDYLLFPSPCGEKVGINTILETCRSSSTTMVSVPLRGKGRDQLGP